VARGGPVRSPFSVSLCARATGRLFPSFLFISLPPSPQVRLKARSMKDEESTQNCTQVFVVVTCQPRSLEVVIAQQRYLLCPGDHFFVPQGTQYNLTNYSPDTEATVAFIVIKPTDSDIAPAPASAPPSAARSLPEAPAAAPNASAASAAAPPAS